VDNPRYAAQRQACAFDTTRSSSSRSFVSTGSCHCQLYLHRAPFSLQQIPPHGPWPGGRSPNVGTCRGGGRIGHGHGHRQATVERRLFGNASEEFTPSARWNLEVERWYKDAPLSLSFHSCSPTTFLASILRLHLIFLSRLVPLSLSNSLLLRIERHSCLWQNQRSIHSFLKHNTTHSLTKTPRLLFTCADICAKS
jgi:hypothetical protein